MQQSQADAHASPSKGRVLVVDDERDVRELVSASLRHAGWDTTEAASAAEALDRFRLGHFDAITLDVNLAGESGYDVCRVIRQTSDVPIVFVTARSDEFDQVLGLELGADNFIIKPFSPKVLAAQVQAVTRRGAREARDETLVAGPVALDPVGRRVRVSGDEVPLSKNEFDLLETLMLEPTRAFERRALLNSVWGASWFGDDHVVEVTIGRLRRKLTAAGAPSVIETVHGVGYRLARF